MSVDLYLGADIGRWVLTKVLPADVGRVVSEEESLLREAADAGFSLAGPPSHLALSVHYPLLFTHDDLDAYHAVYNLHPSYLPYGRGYYPMFWALYAGEPAGATLHRINGGIDTGPIVDQVSVYHDATDDGPSLYRRVRAAERDLFLRYWPHLANGVELPAHVQPPGGSYHSKSAFEYLLATSATDDSALKRCLIPQ